LTALADRQPASYRELVERTGIYSNLPAELRSRHRNTLGAKALIHEEIYMIAGETAFAFTITAKGWTLLGKPVVRGSVMNYEQRHLDWLAWLRDANKLGERVGLAGRNFLVLECLGYGELATYNDIAQRTSIYSGLPWLLLSRHGDKNSLGSKGLVRDDALRIDGEKTYVFSITREGRKLLDRAAEM
jgi:hypothetical protein